MITPKFDCVPHCGPFSAKSATVCYTKGPKATSRQATTAIYIICGFFGLPPWKLGKNENWLVTNMYTILQAFANAAPLTKHFILPHSLGGVVLPVRYPYATLLPHLIISGLHVTQWFGALPVPNSQTA